MTDIRVYDFEFNLLYIMTDVISSEWRILYNGVGTYEGHFRVSDKVCEKIMKNTYVVIIQGDLQAICVGKIIERELIVCGRTLNWLLSRRVRPPFKTSVIYGGEYVSPELVLIDTLKWGFTQPPLINADGSVTSGSIDPSRRIDNFVLPEPVGYENFQRHFWRTGANDIETIVSDLCQKMNRGHKIVFDIKNRQWKFEFIFPSENNKILISEQTKTAYDITYTEDFLNYASGGWYPYNDPDNEDYDEDTNWHYMIADDTKQGIYLWDTAINGTGTSEAEKELQRKKLVKKIDAKIRKLNFSDDYNIGDSVTAYVKFGEFEKMNRYIISGVNIKYTSGENYIQPVLEEYEQNDE